MPDLTVPDLDPRPAEPVTAGRMSGVGRYLLVFVAAVTIVVPVLLDAVVLRAAHIDNPAWLPHAKLHAAMSFLAPVTLGIGALVCLLARPVTDRFVMTLGAYLAGAFWVVVLAAGLWPGTSYFFVGDPVYGHPTARPETLGMPDNVATAVLVIALVLTGVGLLLGGQGRSSRRRGAAPAHPPVPAR